MQGAVEESLIRLGYADMDDIMKAKAEQHGLHFVELREIEIPPSVIELVPESLARENIVMPLSQESGPSVSSCTTLWILRRSTSFGSCSIARSRCRWHPRIRSSRPSINYYGSSSSETESVDSMLQEFTDTAIDFAEDEGAGGAKSVRSPTLWKRGTRRLSGWCT